MHIRPNAPLSQALYMPGTAHTACQVAALRPIARAERCERVETVTAQGKSGKGGQKKGPGSLMDIPKPQAAQETPTVEPWQETEVIMNNLLLVESYSRNVGR